MIVESTGPLSFRVAISGGRTMRCHQDQLRLRAVVNEHRNEDEPDMGVTDLSDPTCGLRNPGTVVGCYK